MQITHDHIITIDLLLKNDQTYAFVAASNAARDNFRERILIHLNSFPEWFRPKFRTMLKSELTFKNGMELILVGDPSHLRGRTLQAVFVEPDLLEKTREFILPALPRNSLGIIEYK